jgi:hypothetical protein
MKKILSAIFIFSLFAGSALAKDKACRPRRHAKIPAIKGLTYHKARKRMLAAGWKPVRAWSSSDVRDDFGNSLIFRRHGYIELEACAGTGWAQCAFLFKDTYGNQLRVVTAGEEFPEYKEFATVYSFRFVCER